MKGLSYAREGRSSAHTVQSLTPGQTPNTQSGSLGPEPAQSPEQGQMRLYTLTTTEGL